MDNMKVSKVYAKAIFDLAKSKNLVLEVLDMLNSLVDQIDRNEELKKVLEYPTISKDEKSKLIKLTIINKDILDLNILDYLIEKNRISDIVEIRNQYLEIYYEIHNELIVTGIFPKELNEEQKEKLVKKLEKLKNKKILLYTKVDEALIAGGILKIKDEVIDGSLKTQLNELKKAF